MKRLFGCFFCAAFCTVSALAAPNSSVRNVSGTRVSQNDDIENFRSEKSARNETAVRTVRRNNDSGSKIVSHKTTKENERDNTKAAVVSRSSGVAKSNAKENVKENQNVVSRTAKIKTVQAINPAKRNVVASRSSGKEVANNIDKSEMRYEAEVDERNVQTRASFSFGSNKSKTITAESLAEAKDILEKTADLNNTCQEQYNECMDQFCAVVDTNQKRCSCSANLAKYQKAQKAVEEASDELNDVAQRIRYVGLSADEIRAIMNATEAEQAMSKNRDNTETRSMLEDIEEMIKDPTAAVSYTSSGGDSLLEMDFDFSEDSSDMFSLGDMFSSSNNDISNKRGKDLYNEAVKRCKSVLNSCKSAGGTESQITGNYDLAIDKDCIAYEQGLQKLNTTLKNNVRSANLMLQKARLSVLQNKNQYDIKGCVAALENCMLDDMVCGTDYIKCLDPTKMYIDENGQVVLGRNIPAITEIMQNYSNSNITSDFIKNSENNTTCPQKDGACIVNYLMSKIGKGATVKDGGLCRAVLDKCQDYTYVEKGKSSEYNPYNDVVVNYIQRAMVNIKAAQSKIIANYASTCMSQISECYNQQMTQLSSWTSNASAENVYNVLTGACYNVALTCGYAIYAYDIEMGERIDAIRADNSLSLDAKDKTQKLTLIQAVSDLFYNQLLCPDNSTFVQSVAGDNDNDSEIVKALSNRMKGGLTNNRCKCNDGYTVWNGSCVQSCIAGEYRTSSGGCDKCTGTDNIEISSDSKAAVIVMINGAKKEYTTSKLGALEPEYSNAEMCKPVNSQ